MAFTGGDDNGAVMADLVADKQRIEAKLAPYVFLEKVTLASQAKSTTIGVGVLYKGARPYMCSLNPSVSLGSSKISVGPTGSTAKYRASAVLTATDAWEDNALNAAVGDALTADEEVLIHNSADAVLPASGTLRVAFWFLLP